MDALAQRDTGAAVLPALIAGAGEKGTWRFVEFFTVNISQAAFSLRRKTRRRFVASHSTK
jgi:hypothetical protein